MIASFRGYIQAVAFLLSKNVDVLIKNSFDQKSALDYAKEKNHFQILELLKKKF